MCSSRVLGVLLAIAALLVFPALAAAHAHLESTDPEAGANLDEPPTEVTVTFDDELQPDGSGFTVADADGNEVGDGSLDLDVAERNVLRGEVSITDPGLYTVSWEIVAEDGHPDSGEFTFGYRADAERAAADAERAAAAAAAPDTALRPAEGHTPLGVIGVLLLVTGVGLAARRRLSLRRIGSSS
jgi:methionine-rich copper-binding protein CopC